MPQMTREYPKNLRPLISHGVSLSYVDGDSQARATCPFCSAEKFYVGAETGKWDCKRCGVSGNALQFVEKVWKDSQDATKSEDYSDLANDRKLLEESTLEVWGIARSITTGNWVVPAFDANGKFGNLYEYRAGKDGRRSLQSTAAFEQKLHWVEKPKDKSTVYVCEGVWDAMALWEVLGASKPSAAGDGTYTHTANKSISLLSHADVIAANSCNVNLGGKWSELFAGKNVVLMFDSDHLERDGKIISAGYSGMRKVTQDLASAESPPESIQYLKWGENGYDPSQKSGYDVRDFLTQGRTALERIDLLKQLFDKVQVVPTEWIAGRGGNAVKRGGTELELLDCYDWKTLRAAWRKAMKWIDGLDRALACMLATILSTESQGDQLWMKIIGPPSCLDGDTPIFDPVDGSNLSVERRWKEGKKFFVWTRKNGGELGIAQALPPQRYSPTTLYDVVFQSGRTLRVTGGHRLWSGDAYVSVEHLLGKLRECGTYPLPTISDIDLSTQMRDVRSSMQRGEGSQFGYPDGSCSCGEQPRSVEVSSLSGPPSPLDVPEPSYHPPRPLHIPPYTKNALDSGDATLLEDVVEDVGQFRVYEDGVGSSLDSCRTYGNTRQSLHQTDRPESSPEPSALTKSAVAQSHAPVGFYRRGPDPLLDEQQCRVERVLLRTDGHTPASSPDSNHVSAQVGIVRRESVGISEPQETPHASAEKFPLGYIPVDRDGLPQADGPETKEQPFYTSIKVVVQAADLSILSKIDEVVKVVPVGDDYYFDFSVPETGNYWAEGFFHHNCGKSVLCEAISVNRKYVLPKSTIRGLFSGYQTDRAGSEDSSLAPLLKNKTLVTKDGDTLLQMPNRPQILAEFRDMYDRVSRTQYRNKMSRDYEGISLTWILCGTESLRQLDTSELGERMLDCVIIDQMEPELEDEIALRKAYQADNDLSYKSDGRADSRDSPEMVMAKRLTGGYIEYLRENAQEFFSQTPMSHEMKLRCVTLATFVAFMRSRPSEKQEETAQRELNIRLVSQLTRLAKCLAVVLNRKEVDEEVMSRVRQVALDTARGRTFNLCKILYEKGDRGAGTDALATITCHSREKEWRFLNHLRKLGAVKQFDAKMGEGLGTRKHWRLTPRLKQLCEDVLEDSNNA